MRRRPLALALSLLVIGCGTSADAQLAKPEAPKTLQQIKAPQTDESVQMKATLIKLQVQVLERDREIGTLRAQVAELQLNALGTAVQTLDPEVKKALGLDQQKPAEKPAPKE